MAGSRFTQGWDGARHDVNAQTGKIVRKYTKTLSLAGVPVRVELVKYALDRGKTVICNTFSDHDGGCSLAANRFSETWGQFDPMGTPTGGAASQSDSGTLPRQSRLTDRLGHPRTPPKARHGPTTS